ncbi:hypothetical protein [Methanolobus halotolerans]|uniref:Uncharacterized protein n=1 Tax=Methanolobus halotolerans TaxID=2052935 RepID=A0A4E0PVT4_9EURY|nr:hypothetical protein [Methanolobus halotolerans]TGC09468.1 hypothetical protein CUN85_06465 [Methanolobus halotolerans]
MAYDMNEKAQKVLFDEVNKIKEKRLNAERDEIIKVRKEAFRVDRLLSVISAGNLFAMLLLGIYLLIGNVVLLILSILLSGVAAFVAISKLDADLDYKEMLKEYKVMPYGRYKFFRIVNVLPLLISSFLGILYMGIYYP